MALYEPPGDEDGCRGASSPASATNSSSDHLSRLLEGPLEAAEAAAEAARLRPTADSEEDEVSNDAARRRFRNLSEEHIAILSSLNQNQLLKVVDQICERQHPLDAVLDNVAADVAATVRKVAEQQRQADADSSLDADQATAVAASNSLNKSNADPSSSSDYFLHVARFVPLRLTFEERVFLRLLESTLEVSEYTDKIDILCGGSKARRMAREIRQVCAILSGLALAHNYEEGQRLVRDHDFVSNRAFFQTVFEIGRRYKILNPERMRSAYGKLIYLLMDAKKPEVLQLLQFDCVTPVNTVYSLLAGKKNGLQLLKDPLVRVATMEIMPEGKSRAQIQREIKEKQNAIKTLARKYAGRDVPKHSPGFFGLRLSFFQRSDSGGDEGLRAETGDERSDLLTPDEIEQCLYSLGDHNTYLRFNREPCDRMIGFLRQYFDPSEPEEGYSLAISSGTGGARLTHSHSRQFVYVLQSLTLWREVCSEMFVLWQMAEADMLHSGNCYRLRDTGQGLNRVQDCPRVSNAMYAILERVQRLTTSWVGSAVVHLGDHNVPNALMFIDKYTQVPRILGPLVLCLEKLPEVYESKQAMRNYFDNQFGGLHALRKQILCDFFRHAFDGSGGDNFFDAGSCIDGRLTSAWNWCSTIEKKRFFPAFLLTGFQGFDGKF
ncbi:putative adenylosuccinate lyase [Toxoplasma gondii TgCatPRC2]|uniref:Putative adenylosuccinate lyase n=11 Tax=Toxoplasma gondii TaxID=5811 RepID=S7W8K0_TOXGG|nr:putative adenylosuccinate lyase [Toxoplasma gondii GT1]KAF4638989.1 putative adenylosuccinate lyase [Toxoplasma gondii]KFG32313.1 putative adenylosuccinate lyase [Toxoplasma gondii p89]KFG34334.1 putative adenylosuccinate lyase [Toxoplasma gondii GAB2-2007-GAL-DOM2]KFG45735.1 putative adenylosuccinate lyase [Toxoplasma gondii FOU]KFG58635.1 putative adenylosuccinate lyase [Toxoplasma gondii RUB]KFH09406.1 putative adenylosuccinate lyase [Toxoplasma gondii VAND]KYK65214.1 putative adenylos